MSIGYSKTDNSTVEQVLAYPRTDNGSILNVDLIYPINGSIDILNK